MFSHKYYFFYCVTSPRTSKSEEFNLAMLLRHVISLFAAGVWFIANCLLNCLSKLFSRARRACLLITILYDEFFSFCSSFFCLSLFSIFKAFQNIIPLESSFCLSLSLSLSSVHLLFISDFIFLFIDKFYYFNI
jgi:hypothetical protein